MHLNEEQLLIVAAQKGDQTAFEQLILQYEATVYDISYKMVKNETDAYDIAQEVLIKIWKQIPKFKGQCKFSTWVYRITYNQCLDSLRKQKRKREISLFRPKEEKEDLYIIEEIDENECVEKQILQKEYQKVIQEALLEIKEEYRLVLILRDMKGYSYEEIATIAQLSLGTVKSRINRARAALKKVLLKDEELYSSFFRLITKKEATQDDK